MLQRILQQMALGSMMFELAFLHHQQHQHQHHLFRGLAQQVVLQLMLQSILQHTALNSVTLNLRLQQRIPASCRSLDCAMLQSTP